MSVSVFVCLIYALFDILLLLVCFYNNIDCNLFFDLLLLSLVQYRVISNDLLLDTDLSFHEALERKWDAISKVFDIRDIDGLLYVFRN